jgi:hypothetical protein
MYIAIKGVHHELGKIIVDFTTSSGIGIAEWQDEPPQIGKEYFVEYDIEQTLVWEQDVFPSLSQLYLTELIENNDVMITGKIESIDEDGFIVMRDNGYMITAMTEKIPLEIIGTFVSAKIKKLLIYPYDEAADC